MNQVAVVNPYALKRIGIPVILEPDFSHGFTTVFFDSKCHEFQGEWSPEPDSPKAGSTQGKFHWQGSNCNVVRGRFAYVHKARILSGNEFDKLQLHERCGVCHPQFEQA